MISRDKRLGGPAPDHMEMGKGGQHSKVTLRFLLVKTSRSFKWRGDANMTCRHLLQTCASPCHSQSTMGGGLLGVEIYRWKERMRKRELSGRALIVMSLSVDHLLLIVDHEMDCP